MIISILGLVFGLIPFVGVILFGLLALVVGIYGLVWQIDVVMAVHRLSGGKATGAVLLLVVVGIVWMTTIEGMIAHLH